MYGNRLIAIGVLFFLWIAPITLSDRATAAPNRIETSKKFVQDFYDWYASKALKENSRPTWDLALELRRSDFGQELAQLLGDDIKAQAACNELIGLDFDPILNTQEPAQRYVTGNLVRKGEHSRIEIYSVRDGIRSKKPEVEGEIFEQNRHFQFINFLYPNGRDLLGILKSPRPACADPRPKR